MRELTDDEALPSRDNAVMDCIELSSAASLTMYRDEEALIRSRRLVAYMTALEARNAELWETLRELWIDSEACPECCNNDSTDRAEKLLGGR